MNTERLKLTEFIPADSGFVLKLLNSPNWVSNIGDRQIRTIGSARKYIEENIITAYENHGYGLYKVCLRETNTPIGMCGLINRDTLENIDIGIALLPEYEGKGYAYEATRCILDWALNDLHLSEVVAITLPTNTLSKRLIDRLGFKFVKKVLLKGDTKELDYYTFENVSTIKKNTAS